VTRAPERRVLATQFAAACSYTALLALLRERYERAHLTELTVIGGVLLSLAPASWLARRSPTTWSQYERRAARGFATVAAPITLWQAWLFVRQLRGALESVMKEPHAVQPRRRWPLLPLKQGAIRMPSLAKLFTFGCKPNERSCLIALC
jgi:hypothetical protein